MLVDSTKINILVCGKVRIRMSSAFLFKVYNGIIYHVHFIAESRICFFKKAIYSIEGEIIRSKPVHIYVNELYVSSS